MAATHGQGKLPRQPIIPIRLESRIGVDVKPDRVGTYRRSDLCDPDDDRDVHPDGASRPGTGLHILS